MKVCFTFVLLNFPLELTFFILVTDYIVPEGQQRETIQRSRGRLRDVEAGLGQSSTLLSRMVFRAQQNKIVLLLLALVILLVLIFGIYRLASRH